jgi:hypothetical protein
MNVGMIWLDVFGPESVADWRLLTKLICRKGYKTLASFKLWYQLRTLIMSVETARVKDKRLVRVRVCSSVCIL